MQNTGRQRADTHFELIVAGWLDWCLDNGWDSDEAIAKALNLSPVTVWRIQNGRSAPGPAVIAAVWRHSGLQAVGRVIRPRLVGRHRAALPERIAA